MSLYNGPPRPGARGGRGEFSWDNVKSDKDREYYLGHSVKATTGRWQKGKDVFWYNKEKADGGVSRDELEAVKAREREMMAEALGLKPKSAPKAQPALEKHEVEKLLKGGGGDDDGAALEGERMQGLGFGSKSAVSVREEVHHVLQGTGLPTAPAAAGAGAAGGGAAGGGSMLTAEQLAALDKADRRAAKKAEKKAKKKAKKGKKEKKSTHKHRSRDPSSSSSDSEDKRAHHKGGGRLDKEQQQHHHQQRDRYEQQRQDRDYSSDRGRGGRITDGWKQPQQHSGRQRSRSPAAQQKRRSRSRSPAARQHHRPHEQHREQHYSERDRGRAEREPDTRHQHSSRRYSRSRSRDRR